MTWQAFILISVLLYSIGTLLQRILMKEKESDPWSFSIIFQFLVGVLILIYTLVTTGKGINLTVPFYHPNLLLMTALWAGANVLSYNALKLTEASTFSILFSTRVLFTLFASTIFLKETVGTVQILGILMIIAGVVIVSYQKKGFKVGKKELFTVLAAACVGLANTNDRAILSFLDAQTYAVISYIFPALFLFVLRPSAIKKLKSLTDVSRSVKTLILGAFWVGFSLTFNFALKNAPSASQVSAAALISVITTVLLSIIFLGERNNLVKKILGSVISFVGLLLVSK